MTRNLYWVLATLCVTHAVLVCYAVFESSGRALFLMIATALWFVWPIIIWRVGAKKWRLALPLSLGFTALLPAVALCLLWFLMGLHSAIQEITAKRSIGHGDAGQFILQTAERYGGIPLATNGLLDISGQWKYVRYKDGRTTIRLSEQAFPVVQKFLIQSLDLRQGFCAPGYYQYELSTNGANIELLGEKCTNFKYTELHFLRHPPPPLSMNLYPVPSGPLLLAFSKRHIHQQIRGDFFQFHSQ